MEQYTANPAMLTVASSNHNMDHVHQSTLLDLLMQQQLQVKIQAIERKTNHKSTCPSGRFSFRSIPRLAFACNNSFCDRIAQIAYAVSMYVEIQQGRTGVLAGMARSFNQTQNHTKPTGSHVTHADAIQSSGRQYVCTIRLAE